MRAAPSVLFLAPDLSLHVVDAAPAHAPPLLHLPVLRAWMAGEAAPDAAPNIDESVLAQAMLLMRE